MSEEIGYEDEFSDPEALHAWHSEAADGHRVVVMRPKEDTVDITWWRAGEYITGVEMTDGMWDALVKCVRAARSVA